MKSIDVKLLRDCIRSFDFAQFRGQSKKDIVEMADKFSEMFRNWLKNGEIQILVIDDSFASRIKKLSDVENENRKLRSAVLDLGLEFDAFGVPGAAEAFVKEFIRLRRLCTAEIRTFSEERFNRVADLIEKTALDMEAEHG